MAPAAPAPVKRATYDGSRPRFESLEAWLNVYGNAEYAIYKRDAAPKPLSYEDWSKSEHVLGPFLWYTTLDVWEEDSSSDEESEVEAPAFTARVPPKQQSKRAAMTNGHGKRGAAKPSPFVAQSRLETAAAAAKRRRKPKKPYLSEDIVVSDVSDEVEEPSPAVEVPPIVTTVPTSPTSGRRKSGGRRKKHYLSAEIISPEDENDDPGAMNDIVASASTANGPNASEQPARVAAAASETPKGKPSKKTNKKLLSQSLVSKDDEQLGDAPADATTTPKNAAASPDGPGSSSRRGLRTRTPAQQRPYFHNAQVFDDLVSDETETDTNLQPSPPKPKQKLKLTGLAQVSFPEVEEERQESEEGPITTDDDDNDEQLVLEPGDPQPARKAHYKGKGRAWKKTSDDEDQDYKSPVKVKLSQPTRKLGRRKSTQTTESPAEAPRSEEHPQQLRQDEQEEMQVDPVPQDSVPKPGKKPRKPRKISHLSEEFVRDDSDTALDEQKGLVRKAEPEKTQSIEFTNPAQKTPKKRGRPRKSDSASKSKKAYTTANDDLILATKDSRVTTPAKPAPSPKKDTKKSVDIGFAEATGDESIKPEVNGRGHPRNSATPGKTAKADHVDLTRSTPPTKTSERSAEVISLSGSDSEDVSEPEVISGKNPSRRMERALTSDLQALDESGKAVTLPGPSVTEASKPADSPLGSS
ncbi:hypothetical protein SLS60_006635 [Paraconiothyrium brasiliense]|uniref:Uncharacterized protein n=1 Tax=Paraconiothyrium brasiliense TaxID=300254 RepID=A0ABR3RBB0_9PLEO